MFRQVHQELRWNELSDKQRSETSIALQSPYIVDFFADLDRLNEGTTRAGVRQYLLLLLTRGELRLRSPFDGTSISSNSSFITSEKHCIMGFVNTPGIVLVISDLGAGFPISSVAFIQGGTLVHLTSAPWVIGLSRLHSIECGTIGARSPPYISHISIVVGDANFAHHAWNQLSAISDLLRVDLISKINRILVTHEPLGRIQSIFPELPSTSIIRVPDSCLEGQNEPGSMIVPVGSRLLTEEVVQRIHAVASGGHVNIRPRSSPESPTLWMSVRTRGRTPVNQVDLLTAVGTEFLRVCPNGSLIIDGHSTPMDLREENIYDVEMVAETVLCDKEVVDTVGSRIQSVLGSSSIGRIVKAVGLSVLQSIDLASTATFYFCHHGTVQHKIGWFTSCRGIIHSSRKVISMMPEDWVKAQSAVAVRPIYLDGNLVVDVPYDTADARMSSLFLDNYIVLQCDAVAQFVAAKALEYSPS